MSKDDTRMSARDEVLLDPSHSLIVHLLSVSFNNPGYESIFPQLASR